MLTPRLTPRMRITVTLQNGEKKKGTLDPTEKVATLMQRLGICIQKACLLTTSGLPLAPQTTCGECGIRHGDLLEAVAFGDFSIASPTPPAADADWSRLALTNKDLLLADEFLRQKTTELCDEGEPPATELCVGRSTPPSQDSTQHEEAGEDEARKAEEEEVKQELVEIERMRAIAAAKRQQRSSPQRRQRPPPVVLQQCELRAQQDEVETSLEQQAMERERDLLLGRHELLDKSSFTEAPPANELRSMEVQPEGVVIQVQLLQEYERELAMYKEREEAMQQLVKEREEAMLLDQRRYEQELALYKQREAAMKGEHQSTLETYREREADLALKTQKAEERVEYLETHREHQEEEPTEELKEEQTEVADEELTRQLQVVAGEQEREEELQVVAVEPGVREGQEWEQLFAQKQQQWEQYEEQEREWREQEQKWEEYRKQEQKWEEYREQQQEWEAYEEQKQEWEEYQEYLSQQDPQDTQLALTEYQEQEYSRQEDLQDTKLALTFQEDAEGSKLALMASPVAADYRKRSEDLYETLFVDTQNES